MYRLQVEDAQGNQLGYQNVANITEAQFVDVAVGAKPATQPVGDWPPGGTVYSAVWDPEVNTYVSNITTEQAIALYPSCFREVYP